MSDSDRDSDIDRMADARDVNGSRLFADYHRLLRGIDGYIRLRAHSTHAYDAFALGLAPVCERREIGVLKAVGWSTSDVLAARMWESALVGLVGATLGLVVGYVHAFVFGAPGLADALFGWSSLHASLSLPPALDFAQLLAILGAVVVPFVGVSVVPAWRAAMLDPDRLLRGGP